MKSRRPSELTPWEEFLPVGEWRVEYRTRDSSTFASAFYNKEVRGIDNTSVSASFTLIKIRLPIWEPYHNQLGVQE